MGQPLPGMPILTLDFAGTLLDYMEFRGEEKEAGNSKMP